MQRVRFVISFLIFVAAGNSRRAEGCSGFGSSGKATADGSTIVVKIRDGGADNLQRIRILIPAGGLKYIGIFGPATGPYGGIN